MRPRQAKNLPRLWLFTDERIDSAALLAAVTRLPRGSGIVFRHYGWPKARRRVLFEQLRAVAWPRQLVLLLGGNALDAIGWRADGWHSAPGWRRRVLPARQLLRSAPCHSVRQLQAARREGADLAFLSPVFATRSHPGSPTLGPLRFALMTRNIDLPVLALGGMTPRKGARLRALGAHGWGAIDALSTPGD